MFNWFFLTDCEFMDYIKQKLVGYASDYWIANENGRNTLFKKPIVVWSKMKTMLKRMPLIYSYDGYFPPKRTLKSTNSFVPTSLPQLVEEEGLLKNLFTEAQEPTPTFKSDCISLGGSLVLIWFLWGIYQRLPKSHLLGEVS